MCQTHSFFKFIQDNYGYYIVKKYSKRIKYRKLIIKNNLRIKFIKDCIKYKIIPQYLNGLTKFNIDFHHHKSTKKFTCCKESFVQKTHIELNDAHRSNHFCRMQVFHLANILQHHLSVKICDEFLNKEKIFLFSFYQREKKIRFEN